MSRSSSYSALIISFVMLLIFGFAEIQATNLYVPSEHTTIQAAIDAAADNDTILVSPGTYSESINYLGKLIVVMSSDGPLVTTLTSDASSNLVTFTNNETSTAILEGFHLKGGWIGILCENASPTINRNILSGQNVTNWGAISLGGDGYATFGLSPAVIVNNTIVGCANGGISTYSTEAPIIKNNIIAFNAHYGVHRWGTMAHPIFSYNDVYGNSVSYQEMVDSGIGTISADPLFGPDYTLQLGSPCIDAGDPDVAYNDPDDSRNDIGAIPYDESVQPHDPMILHVPSEYATIQSAINAAIDEDTVLVASGTYEEHLNFGGKNLKLLSESGPKTTFIKAAVTVLSTTENSIVYELPDLSDTLITGKSGFEQAAEAQRYSSPAVITMTGGCNSTTEISGFTIDGRNAVRGIYGIGVDPVVSDCIVENCVGGYDAGGMFFEHGAPTIINNIVRNNMTPISGGGIFVRLGVGYGTVKIIGNTIYGNISGNGPAISLIEGDDALVERNVAYSNTATPGSQRRGAIYFRGSDIHVINNTSDRNTVGMTALSSTDCDVRNNIITNSADDGLEYLSDVGPNNNLTNDYNDVWNNGGFDYVVALPGTNDISENPAFNINYYLLPTSPCIDAGDPDADYNDPDGSRNDIGAIPFDETVQPHDPMTLHVPSEYTTIQSAINAAIDGDTVLVASGTYEEHLNFGGKNIKLLSESGPDETIIKAAEGSMVYELPDLSDTLITGKSGFDQAAEAQRLSSPAVITMTGGCNSTTEISGLTIDGRDAVRGIYGIGVDPIVSDCIVENCVGGYDAGGMFFEHGAPTIINNIVRNNITPISGGGIFVRLGVGYGTVKIIGNTIYGNISGNGPAISLIEGDDALVERNVAYSNTATPGSQRRGAIYFRGSDIHVINNTSDRNTVGITALSSTDCDVRNNIITNSVDDGLEYLSDVGPNNNLTNDYNDVWNNSGSDYVVALPGANDISENPAFSVNYYLLLTSPCIDAGDPDANYNDPDGSRNDIGAIPYDESVQPHDPMTLYVPSEYATIQLAINASYDGDTVLVSPGIYSESINYFGKQIIVTSVEGPGSTTITEADDVDLVIFSGGETSLAVLEGFRLEGGRIGVLCENAGPTIRRNILANQNIANWGAISLGGNGYTTGGSATVGPSPAVIINNTITNCSNGGISTFSSVAPVIKNNIIANNYHYGIHREGIIPGVAQPLLSYNDVYGNAVAYQEIADSGVGTIAADPMFGPDYTLQSGSPCIDSGDPDATYNDPDGSRNDIGAIPYDESVQPHDPVTLRVPSEYATIQLAINASYDGDTVLVSPGTYSESINYFGKQIIVTSVEGPGSTTITEADDVDLVTFSGGETSLAVLEGFRLEGGRIGVLCENAGPTIRRNILANQNIANWGAISLGGNGYATIGTSPAVIINNTIVDCANGGISTFSIAPPTIKNNIIADNFHYGIHREGTSLVAQPILSYNDVYGNQVAYQEIADPGIGTIAANPLFGPDYTLKSGSPCIDSGDPDATYNDPDGSRNDIGAVPYDFHTAVSPGSSMPTSFALSQNFPNPFNPTTTIEYQISVRSQVNLIVYDLLGRQVKTLVSESKPAGTYFAVWSGKDADGKPVSSGVYFYRLKAGDFVQSMKMLLIK